MSKVRSQFYSNYDGGGEGAVVVGVDEVRDRTIILDILILISIQAFARILYSLIADTIRVSAVAFNA